MERKSLRVGDSGELVALLQQSLTERGYKIPRTEAERRFFGPATRQAVRSWQIDQELRPTGEVDQRSELWAPSDVGPGRQRLDARHPLNREHAEDLSTLAELRVKWFIDPSASDPALPPTARHPTSTVQRYTDGNLVEFLVDGKDYMRVWHDSVLDLTGRRGGEILHSGWRFEGVRTLGQSVPDSNALLMLQAASLAGVRIYVLLSKHGLGLPSVMNQATVDWLRLNDVPQAAMDNRFPPLGSNHQKAVVFKHLSQSTAVLGSIDISKTRWDTSMHLRDDAERDRKGKATHDTGVRITGPAVADVEAAFRVRWNDSSRDRGLEPKGTTWPLLTSAPVAPMSAGTHSVQLLQTYGRTLSIFGYSWAATGEFTYWASWLNAVMKAKNYIYIEDQYFFPGGTPPFALEGTAGFARDTEPIYQLGQALERGVKVLVVTPSNAEDVVPEYIKYQRDLGIQYLFECDAGNGLLQIASLEEGRSPVYVHSKLLLADDEFMIVGSGNVGQRSTACDGELSVGVVDGAEQLVLQVRTALWAEHLRRTPAEVKDVDAGLARFRANQGRVRPYPYATPSANGRPRQHDFVMRTVVDPYYGPPR